MECIAPISAGFTETGEITFSKKQYDKSIESVKFPCRKCLPCRLNNAREKAIRAVHEAKTHEDNIFLTLTYSDDHISDGRLHYKDFQLFMKKLRKSTNNKIGFMVTGEYGDKTKRPHWHAILFNYAPRDSKILRSTHDGQKIYSSEHVTKLWGKGFTEYGSVTIDSAGYVARYGAKKLCHGKDQDHQFQPIHRTSCKRAMGKTWIEENWRFTFQNGFVVLPNGQTAKIPRYYQDWLKKEHPEEYFRYVTEKKQEIIKHSKEKSKKEEHKWFMESIERSSKGNYLAAPKKTEIKLTILKQKFKLLQSKLKL